MVILRNDVAQSFTKRGHTTPSPRLPVLETTPQKQRESSEWGQQSSRIEMEFWVKLYISAYFFT